ncbi:MAG: hypothetical protein LBU83_09605 [Bacteroidales bacterium]|jgi:hypothetical protein|nr:hypothetical protein [Bacteroidales bacterium]
MIRFAVFLSLFFFVLRINAQQNYPNVQYNEELKQLTIFVDRKPAIKIVAEVFAFHPELVVAQDAITTIYLDSDSIYHPCTDINYNPTTTELWITKKTTGLGRAPYFDSYHKLEIVADAIYGKMNTPLLEFRKTLPQNLDKPAFFQSQDFFDAEIMKSNKGYNDKNPMLQLWELFKANSFQPISLRHVVNSFRRAQSDINSLLIEYAVQGFIDYDLQNDVIYYKKKLTDYLNNESKRRDYDNLFWKSKSHRATLNLENFDLIIYDCDFFVLSNTHIVNVYPVNETVTVKKNRDLHFSGRVIGGLFDFVAKDCSFDYDKFMITMPQIDTMIMFSEDKSKPKDIYGEYPLKKVKNVVEEISGTLFIDAPNNKSSNKTISDYPIFESREGGKVYFDQPFILNAEYKRDTFYFMIDYFVIKNLDNFNIDSTKIPGRLVSGNIFPDIYEPLKLQPDNSLGFIHYTDSKGVPLFDGQAHFYNTIELSNNGLRGKGKIEYLTSTVESDSLVFYLQSVRGKANSFQLKPMLADVEYPEAATKQARMFFDSKKNEMQITSIKTPFDVFDESSFDGTLTLSPKALTGNGILNFKRAELQSKLMTLKNHALEAEHADLRIFENENEKKYAFITNSFLAQIDFLKRTGVFTAANQENAEVRFVSNGFKANAQTFNWNPIDKTLLHFTWDESINGININATPSRELVKMKSKKSLISTIEQGKRGLSFNVQTLDFDFGKNTIEAKGVPFIPVGDAAIIPQNGNVHIQENAVFSPLNNARILAARDNMYHELYNCSVQIENGDDFKGSGYYDYIDAFNTTQTLRFDTIWYFRATKGTAFIPPENDFTLSPHFGFSGNVELNSNQEFLTFSGGVSMIHNCDFNTPDALRINQQIDPKHILIEINNRSRDVNDRRATVAIASSNETGRIYTSMGSAKDQVNDSEYITSLGFITYNYEKQAFQSASLEKLNNPALPGNIISLFNKECISTGEGAIDMGAKLGRVEFNTHGQVVNYMQADSAIMHLTTSINFFFNDESMKIMNEYFANAQDLKFVDPNEDKNYTQSLINILGQAEYEKYEKDRKSGTQQGKLPAPLDVKFLFSTLNFVWSQDNGAFESQKTVPLVISNGKNVYKEIPGRIVIEKKGSRNTLYIYFELKKDFFFFQFDNNSLSVFSSDEKFNNAVTNTKAKDKTLSAKGGDAAFSYKIGNRGQKTRFTRKYFQND